MIATHHRPEHPDPGPRLSTRRPVQAAQSLADGEIARLLLEVELTLTGKSSWDQVAKLLKATGELADRSASAGLFYGAPALSFALDSTGAQGRVRWAQELDGLDQVLVELTDERLDAADARAETGAPLWGSEFDLMTGLTGLGVVLLRRTVHASAEHARHRQELAGALSRVLKYLVACARNAMVGEVPVPGWWSAETPGPGMPVGHPLGGHVDLGMARGGAGVLALLAAAYRARHRVPDHKAAIGQIIAWYAVWRQETRDRVVWWPARLTLEEVRARRVHQAGPGEPTWAFGTVGIARALQMAAIAVGDAEGQVAAEDAIASFLTARELDRMKEPDLYAGTGGMYLTVLRAAEDAEDFRPRGVPGVSMLFDRLGMPADAVSRTSRVLPDPQDTEFLYGRFGTKLVFESLQRRATPVGGADGVLGIGWAEP
ncbi:lanthionine synthetase-like protein [Promicromonospora sp. AC04]|uniref:lanthionine synthetase LanC family protein n=1 Tax=Promicromonospora sp. AC04 TaxID=2135723 RepID=UPI000D4BBE1D|nr:lanthionine synthetase LanC family protein [Promicromonospora sp. AC04]PUB20824.1 lanthionine synthetase-like protein [Promicromonospora sp. AC04]